MERGRLSNYANKLISRPGPRPNIQKLKFNSDPRVSKLLRPSFILAIVRAAGVAARERKLIPADVKSLVSDSLAGICRFFTTRLQFLPHS
jgi:hypothetical protein